jgi:hypothetical protein
VPRSALFELTTRTALEALQRQRLGAQHGDTLYTVSLRIAIDLAMHAGSDNEVELRDIVACLTIATGRSSTLDAVDTLSSGAAAVSKRTR